jgi:hypothetical protein
MADKECKNCDHPHWTHFPNCRVSTRLGHWRCDCQEFVENDDNLLVIDMTDDEYRLIAYAAAVTGQTMEEYVVDVLMEQVRLAETGESQ